MAAQDDEDTPEVAAHRAEIAALCADVARERAAMLAVYEKWQRDAAFVEIARQMFAWQRGIDGLRAGVRR